MPPGTGWQNPILDCPIIARLLPESAQLYSLNGRALCDPVVGIPPGVLDKDPHIRVRVGWRVGHSLGSGGDSSSFTLRAKTGGAHCARLPLILGRERSQSQSWKQVSDSTCEAITKSGDRRMCSTPGMSGSGSDRSLCQTGSSPRQQPGYLGATFDVTGETGNERVLR